MDPVKLRDLIAKSNPAMNFDEVALLLEALKDKKVKVVLEIGVHQGGSLTVWWRYFKPELTIGVDHNLDFLNKRVAAGDFGFMADNPPFCIQGDSRNPKTIREVEVLLDRQPVDLLAIDGGHEYETVKADHSNYSRFLAKDGVTVFHDIALTGAKWIAAGVEVARFWNEIIQGKKYQEFTVDKEGATGLGLLYA